MSQTAKSHSPQEGLRFAPRHGWARNAGEKIFDQASGAFARAGFRDPTFLLRWPDLVGTHIARVAQPLKWEDGPEGAVLTLKCEACAAVLLQHQTRALVERLNAYLGNGRIARIKLKPGRLSALSEPPNHPGTQAEARTESLALPGALERFARLRMRLKARQMQRPLGPD